SVRARSSVRVEPGGEFPLYCTVACDIEASGIDLEGDIRVDRNDGDPAGAARPRSHDGALRASAEARATQERAKCQIASSNPLVDRWLDRSTADIAMLTTDLSTGPYPYAGVPWYSTIFGRDGLITAREYLWVEPTLARGVLACLSA